MHRLRLLVLLLVSAFASVCHAQGYGKYVGKVQTEWLDNDDRRMRLLTPFSYVDPKGTTWTAPAGWVIDGASIPVFAWSVVGGPFNGKYRDASVIHDVACDQKVQPWETVHEAFYWAMMASGVEAWRAKVMYAAVYHFGPRWPRLVTVSVPEDQVGSASEQALAQAEPGSDATVVRVRPQPGAGAGGGPRQDKVDVQIAPPPKTLSEGDFENLKERIRQAEAPPAAPKPRTRSFNAAPPAPAAPGGSASESAPAPVQSERSAGLRTRGIGGGGGGISLTDIRGFRPAN